MVPPARSNDAAAWKFRCVSSTFGAFRQLCSLLVASPSPAAAPRSPAGGKPTGKLTGGDVNPSAVRFTAARLLAEHAWPAERQLTLLAE
jgi:hypothetical protein